MIHYIDSHAHLFFCDHAETSDILHRARKSGVKKLITVSTDDTNWEINRSLALNDKDIFFSLGLHPHTASRYPECAASLARYFENTVPERCVAIGETGLDFHYDLSPRDIQIDVFESQLALANRLNLPVIIHTRDAFIEVFSIIRRMGLPQAGGVMHCFSGNEAQATEAIDLGLHISFSGILTFKNATEVREAARKAPLDRILLETDCPYLSPEPYRGKPNEPCRLPIIAQQLGALRNLTIEEVGYATYHNTTRLFRL